MVQSHSYRITDEPVATGATRWAVNPTFPLLASMLCGAWLAWPWFLFNHYAITGTRPKKALLLAIASVVLTYALWGVSFFAQQRGLFRAGAWPYVHIAVLATKLAFAYAIYASQLGAFELYEHFGNKPRPGFTVVIGGYLLKTTVLKALPAVLAIVLQ